MDARIKEIIADISPDELIEFSKEVILFAKQKRHDENKAAKAKALREKLDEQKLMTQLKNEEKEAIRQKEKMERRVQFSGKVSKGDIVSFLLKDTPRLGKVTKVSAFGVKVDAASAGVLHEVDPELVVDYGFITSCRKEA